jgi:hypothetical protein
MKSFGVRDGAAIDIEAVFADARHRPVRRIRRIDRQVVRFIDRVIWIAVARVTAARVRQTKLMTDLVRVGWRCTSKTTRSSPPVAAGHLHGNGTGNDAVIHPLPGVGHLVQRHQGCDLLQQRLPVGRAATWATSRVVQRCIGHKGAADPYVGDARYRVRCHRPARLRLTLCERGRGENDVSGVGGVGAVVADRNECRVQRLTQVHINLRRAACAVTGARRKRGCHVDREAQQTGHQVWRHHKIKGRVDVAALGVVTGKASSATIGPFCGAIFATKFHTPPTRRSTRNVPFTPANWPLSNNGSSPLRRYVRTHTVLLTTRRRLLSAPRSAASVKC